MSVPHISNALYKITFKSCKTTNLMGRLEGEGANLCLMKKREERREESEESSVPVRVPQPSLIEFDPPFPRLSSEVRISFNFLPVRPLWALPPYPMKIVCIGELMQLALHAAPLGWLTMRG